MTNGRGASWHKTINVIALLVLIIIFMMATCHFDFSMFEDGSVRAVVTTPLNLLSWTYSSCIVPAWGCG